MRSRRWAIVPALLAVASALLGVLGISPGGANAALAPGDPPTAGVVFTPASGDSGTPFTVDLQGADVEGADVFCPGDGEAGFRWSTFIVPTGVDIAALTWGAPLPAGFPSYIDGFAAALTDDTGTYVVLEFPGQGDAFVNVGSEQFSFDSVLGSLMPAGEYQVGVACIKTDNTSITRTEEYWVTTMTIADEDGAGPHGFTYATPELQSTPTTTTTSAPTTTTTPTTTMPGSSTTTSVAGSSTTTTSVAASTTTSVAGSSTTTSTTIVASGSVTTTTVTGSGGSNTGGGSGRLAVTGSSVGWFVISALLLLVAGRMLLLSGREIVVLPPES